MPMNEFNKNKYVKKGASVKKVLVGTSEVRGGKDGITGDMLPEFKIGNDMSARFKPPMPTQKGQGGKSPRFSHSP
jgi:hypothetical protein